MLFADLLSLHLVIFLMFFILVKACVQARLELLRSLVGHHIILLRINFGSHLSYSSITSAVLSYQMSQFEQIESSWQLRKFMATFIRTSRHIRVQSCIHRRPTAMWHQNNIDPTLIQWTALKCKTLGAMVVHTEHKGCSSDIRSTRHTRRTCTDNWWVGSRTAAPPCGGAYNYS